MINFIICSSSKKGVHLYKEIIQDFMGDKKREYNIYLYSDSINISGKKIYFIDNNLAVAKDIRYSGDYDSSIIISFDNNEFDDFDLLRLKKFFALDILFRNNMWIDRLRMYLDIDYKICSKNRSLCFKHGNELFDVLYSDICYIEKNLCNNDSTIVTKNNKYVINMSISKIMDILKKDSRFYKCHRSCIVNINNIVSYDISNNIVKFDNSNISLISRDRKKELENKIVDRKPV